MKELDSGDGKVIKITEKNTDGIKKKIKLLTILSIINTIGIVIVSGLLLYWEIVWSFYEN